MNHRVTYERSPEQAESQAMQCSAQGPKHLSKLGSSKSRGAPLPEAKGDSKAVVGRELTTSSTAPRDPNERNGAGLVAPTRSNRNPDPQVSPQSHSRSTTRMSRATSPSPPYAHCSSNKDQTKRPQLKCSSRAKGRRVCGWGPHMSPVRAISALRGLAH